MSLLMWSEEGNTLDLSYYFLPLDKKQTAGQAVDTPSFMDEWSYAKAPEGQKEVAKAPALFSVWGVVLVFGALYALGVVKL